MEGLKNNVCSDCRQQAEYWCVDCLAYWCEDGSKNFHEKEESKNHKILPTFKKSESLYDKWKELNSSIVSHLEQTLKELNAERFEIEKNSKQTKQYMDLYFNVLLQKLMKRKEELEKKITQIECESTEDISSFESVVKQDLQAIKTQEEKIQ